MDITNAIKSVNWTRAKGHYVIIDPLNTSSLMYLSENRYQKLVAIALSNESEIVVISTPEESREDVYSKFGVKPDGSTPPINDIRAKFSSMFTIRNGWVIRESLICFRRNFKTFLPTYYRDIRSWLGLKNPSFAFSSIKRMSLELDSMRAKSNINFIILYLKVASIAVLQYISGNPLKTTGPLGKRIRLSNGLPSIIPAQIRALIRKGDKTTIRVISSLLHSFKGFEGVNARPSLGAIGAPHAHNVFSLSTWRLRRDNSSYASRFDSNFEPGWYNKYNPSDWTTPTPAERLTWKVIAAEILRSRSTQKRAELDSNISQFWSFFNPKGYLPDLLFSFPRFKLMLSAGPSHRNSILGSHIDAMVIARNKEVRELFEDFIDQANEVQVQHGKSRVDEDCDLLSHIETVGNSLYTNLILKGSYSMELRSIKLFIKEKTSYIWDPLISVRENLDNAIMEMPRGKLALKNEAAGKVRIFAIGDYWSQLLLSPLHDSLFKVLKVHRCDATFDQLGKVSEFNDRNYRFVASYDLKSATDLIPVHLYEDVLSHWTSRAFASVWIELLVSRRYLVPKDKNLVNRTIAYTRGQPMGILSSWASLAMVHHYLVFLSAQRAKQWNFQDYLVLGDDIVIAHPEVAHHYTKVCEEYGVTIGLAKSYVSNTGFFQFASQNMYEGVNVSPISLKEVLTVSQHAMFFGPSTALAAKVEWIRRLRERGFIGNNISDSLKAISTFSEWRRLSSSLKHGIIPGSRLNAIVSILVSELSSATNTYQIDQFLAAMKGEYGLFTGKFSEDPQLRYDYLQACFNYIKQSMIGLLVKAKRGLPNELYDSMAIRVKDVRELIPEVKYAVEPAINEITDTHAELFSELLAEWRVIENRLEEHNTLEYWTVLYSGVTDGRIEPCIEDIAAALRLVERAKALVLEKTLCTGISQNIKQVSRLAVLHKSLLAKLRLSQ